MNDSQQLIELQEKIKRLEKINKKLLSFEEKFKKGYSLNAKFLTELSINDNLIQNITESINDVFVIWNKKNKIDYVSPNFIKLYGRNASELIENPTRYIKWIYKEDRAKIIQKLIKNRLVGKDIIDLKYRITTPENIIKWIWLREKTIYSSDGKKLVKVGISSDITDLKIYERELNNYKDNLELLVRQRTEEFEALNEEYVAANEELNTANEQLSSTNEELSNTNEQLVKEIEERNRIQSLLFESEEKFRSFIQQSVEGISIIDENGKYIEWNIGMETIFGYSLKEVYGKDIFEIQMKVVPVEMRDEKTTELFKKHVQLIKKGDDISQFKSFEREIITKKGQRKFIFLTIFPIKTSKGTLIGTVNRDITELILVQRELDVYKNKLELLVEERTQLLKESQERLIQSNNQLNAILNASPNVIYIEDILTRKIVYISKQVENFGGYTVEECLASENSLVSFIYEEDIPIAIAFNEKVLKAKDNEVITEEYRINTKSKEVLWAHVSEIVFKRDENGIPTQILGILTEISKRKIAEEALQESQNFIERIADTVPAFIYVMDLSTSRNVYINDHFYISLGYSKLDLETIGSGITREMFHPDDYVKHTSTMERWKRMKKDEVLETEYRLRHSNGEWRHFHDWTRVFEYDVHGNVKLILGISQDVTLQRKSQTLLLESEERYRLTAEQTGQLVYDYSLHTGKIKWFGAIEKITGYSFEDFQNVDIKQWEEWIHPEDRKVAMLSLEVSIRSGRSYNTEFRFKHKNDHYFFVEDNGIILYENNKPYRMLGTMKDITDRKNTELILKESEEKFRNIFNATSEGILITDIDGNYLEVNKIAIERSGISREQFLKLNIRNLLNKEHVSQYEKLKEEILVKGRITFESDYLNAKGQKINIEISSTLMSFYGKQAILNVTRDITERKEIEKKLFYTIIETEEKERKRLAQDLHDEIGPLLSSLKMYISTLTHTNDKEKTSYVVNQVQDIVREAITSIREISNDLSPHILTNYGMTSALNNVIENSSKFIEIQSEIEIENKRFSPNIEIVFYRIIKELINNTIKHANATKIEIKIYYENNSLFLKYKDNGIGFDLEKEMLNKKEGIGLFNILSRIKTINGKYKSSGSDGKGFVFEMETITDVV